MQLKGLSHLRLACTTRAPTTDFSSFAESWRAICPRTKSLRHSACMQAAPRSGSRIRSLGALSKCSVQYEEFMTVESRHRNGAVRKHELHCRPSVSGGAMKPKFDPSTNPFLNGIF